MKYIALLYGDPEVDAGPAPGTPEFMQMLSDYQTATAAMADAGVLVDSSPLQPPQTATTVRVRNGETQLSDGPFAEIKEQLGGYYILDCENLEIYLTFTEGHLPHGTGAVVRDDLCEEAQRLARRLHRLLPDEPEVTGLLALILLTSARSAARADQDGALVLLADQDRSRWNGGRLDQGRSLIEAALAQRRPGPYQLQAAIAACHADAATPADTDWRQIAALYSELLRFDPSPVIEANRAIAVAYAEGPVAGLAILDTLAASSRLTRWPQLHIARGALLAQCGRREDAAAAYRDALALEPAEPVRRHISGQIAALGAAPTPTEEA